MANDIATIAKLDAELVSIIQDFQLLAPISWPKETMRQFLRSVERKKIAMPEVTHAPADRSEKIAALQALLVKLGHDDNPAIAFLRDTAHSYIDAYSIIQGVGTTAVNEFSKKLYGCPTDILEGYKRRNIDVARYFLRIAKEYNVTVPDEPLIYTAPQFRAALTKRIRKLLPNDAVSVNVDSAMTARAAAGPNYVKVRKGAMFSEKDLDQLLHHEVMLHTLTYINGRKQTVLKSLGYNAPRTTATQEGLAVFAEYINMSIELVRLRRIALRIIAIREAENGADFVDLFKFFKKHGQNNEESYYSAMRIFRGGLPKGGVIFYKDNVYLRGLIEVESFLKRAMHQGMIHDINLLFCGKLTTSDVLRLQPLAKMGYIDDPVYLPQWAEKSGELAAHLAFNDLTERFRIK